MARRRKSSSQTVSLFPFLSILACVIGCLTLMIAGLALGQMDTQDVKKIELFEIARARLAAEQSRLKQLKKEIERSRKAAAEAEPLLAEKRAELKQLRDELDQLQNRSAEPPVAPVDKKALDRHLTDLQKELGELKKQVKSYQAEIAKRKRPPEQGVVQVRPGGSGVDLDPTFVECAATSVVVYQGSKPRRIRREDLAKDRPFLAMLDRIADQPKATVIFLVRDDGIPTYITARNVARSRYARNGKLPVLGHGRIDLSQFKRKRS